MFLPHRVDHYLAFDIKGKRLRLMYVPYRTDVDNGKIPELNFRYVTLFYS